MQSHHLDHRFTIIHFYSSLHTGLPYFWVISYRFIQLLPTHLIGIFLFCHLYQFLSYSHSHQCAFNFSPPLQLWIRTDRRVHVDHFHLLFNILFNCISFHLLIWIRLYHAESTFHQPTSSNNLISYTFYEPLYRLFTLDNHFHRISLSYYGHRIWANIQNGHISLAAIYFYYFQPFISFTHQ